tara:strand:+ start:282 stop:521 length:240 start_codon:yes stop_codon:yes gene_type:complete
MKEIRKEKIDDKRDLILTKYYNEDCEISKVKFEIAIFTDNYVEHLHTEDELKYANQYFDSYVNEYQIQTNQEYIIRTTK